MQISSLLPAPFAALFLLGQVPTALPGNDPLGGWGSLGLQGTAMALLAYIVVKLAPAALKDAREEREKREATVNVMINAMQERQDVLINALQDRQDVRQRESAATITQGVVAGVTTAIEKQTVLLNRGSMAVAQRVESAVKDQA